MHLSRIAGRRGAAVAAIVATAAGLLIALPVAAVAAPTPPPNPSAGKITAAAAHKAALADQVGVISGQIAAKQEQLQQLQGQAELAEQKVAYTHSLLQQANAAAAKARADIKRAARSVTTAHTKFVQYLQASYMDGAQTGSAGTLLTATDPNALLDETTLEQYQAQNKLDAVGNLQRASVTKSNAEARSRAAALKAKKAAAAAKAAKKQADEAVAAGQAQKIALQNEMAASQQQLDAAQSELATLNNQHAAYVKYQAYQAHLRAVARAKAERERQARIRAQQAAERAAQRHGNNNNGGGGGRSTFSPGPSAPSGGSWTAAKGRQAADRALSRLGDLYIWAAGSKYGPDDGGCNDPIAPCGTIGFDCSGLVLYAWGANWAHFAATQYSQAGSYHPSPDDFRKGDLLFWTGGEGEISHVAIYIGNGDVVQAPQSGDVVKVTPWQQVESGYAGATRPLT